MNTATGLELHQFKWLPSDDHIGEIPHGWNHLVGYDAVDTDARNLHFTEGGPWFQEYADCEHAGEWRDYRAHMRSVVNRSELQVRSA